MPIVAYLTKCKPAATPPTYFLPAAVLSTSPPAGSFYQAALKRSLELNVENPKLRVGPIPVGNHPVKDQPEVPLVTRLQRSGRKRLDIDIRIARPDEAERMCFVLCHFLRRVPEQHLNRNPGYRPVALVRDVAIDIGDLAARQV